MSSVSAFHPITVVCASGGSCHHWATPAMPCQPRVRCNPRANRSPANEKPSFGPGAAQLLALCFSAVCLVSWPSAPRARARALAPRSPSPVIWLQNTFSGSFRKKQLFDITSGTLGGKKPPQASNIFLLHLKIYQRASDSEPNSQSPGTSPGQRQLAC